MKPVEQAIFTAVDAEYGSDQWIVARSAGLCDADAQELAAWQPSRDSLLGLGPDAESFNFHPLPSGAHCISRTTPVDWERGGGQRVHSHCLIVPQEALARFANNPFAVARAVSEQGLWRGHNALCPRLESFSLPGGAAPVDQALLRQLVSDAGPRNTAAVVQTARDAVCLAIAGTRQPAVVIAGLFSCLPPECRLEFSFSTGLKFSPRRPFRIVALSDDPAEQRWAANYPNVTVLELDNGAVVDAVSLDGWAQLIERSLSADRISFLAAQISKRRFDLSLGDLPALGLQLLESLDALDFSADNPLELPQEDVSQPPPAEESPPRIGGRAHAAHRQFEKSLRAAVATLSAMPSSQLDLQSPEVLDKLEYLDDLVYEAIRGQADALERLCTAWPELLAELGEQALAESREQYLRYALSVWEECADQSDIRDPARAIHALDVLCLLFGTV